MFYTLSSVLLTCPAWFLLCSGIYCSSPWSHHDCRSQSHCARILPRRSFSPHWLANLSILSPFERLREPQLPVAGWVFDFYIDPSPAGCLWHPVSCQLFVLTWFWKGKNSWGNNSSVYVCLLGSGFLETRNLILSHQSLVLANKSFVLKIAIHFRIPFCTSVNTAFLDYM